MCERTSVVVVVATTSRPSTTLHAVENESAAHCAIPSDVSNDEKCAERMCVCLDARVLLVIMVCPVSKALSQENCLTL